MIPIHLAPKRFVAALGRARGRFLAIVPDSVTTSKKPQKVPNRMNMTRANLDMSSLENSIETLLSNGTHLVEESPKDLKFSSIRETKLNLNLHGPRGNEWWTGKMPVYGKCPGVSIDGTLHSLPQISLQKNHCSKESLLNYFDNTWTLTELLMASLQGEEAFMIPPYHDLRHPLIFYYGHPAALYVNKLRVAGLLKKPINPYFEAIFETGVDEMSWDDLSKNKMQWPTVAEVHAYRKKVYEAVSGVIQSLTPEQCQSIDQKSPLWALVMAFEHERIHLETSSVLIAELPSKYVRFPSGFPQYHSSISSPSSSEHVFKEPIEGIDYPKNDMIYVEGQNITIGKPTDFPSYGWDNEYGRRVFSIKPFYASKVKVTNGEFYAFVRDGGYSRSEFWSKDGWKWRAFRNSKWPSFWNSIGPQGLNHYNLRLIFDVVPMQWNLPVSVNYHEAKAFAKWKSFKSGKNYRVLTEIEHNAIRDIPHTLDINRDPVVATQDGRLDISHGFNLNLSHSSMSPVDAYPANSKGFYDVFGNAWEWTEDFFCALPGFKVHPYYEDFSTPCFDGLHNVIQGGSFISTGNEASVFARFHFRPHFFQHASFRVVEQDESLFVSSDTDAPGPYVGAYPFRQSLEGRKERETSKMAKISQSHKNVEMSKHFGVLLKDFKIPDQYSSLSMMKRLTNTIFQAVEAEGIQMKDANALEVGSRLGSLTFLMASRAKSVIGIDHDEKNIDISTKLLRGNVKCDIELRGEGDLNTLIESPLHPPQLCRPDCRVEFRMADPMSLPAEMKDFDIVILNDVIDKISAPNALLGRLGGVRGLVKEKGVLAIISGFEWNEDRTPKSLWLGGFKDDNGIISSKEVLLSRLSNDFSLISESQEPIYWQESMRSIRGRLVSVLILRRLPQV